MPACCQQPPLRVLPKAPLTVALAGNPNSGKTTIFNALTGLRQKVANYPGVTVEKKSGRCRLPDGRFVEIVDLPGAYSLVSQSPDERVTMEVLRGLRAETPAPDVIVIVVDASNLQRNLYLLSQVIELGKPVVLALNMIDVARRRGMDLSAEKLQQELGVAVVSIIGHKRRGIAELKEAIVHAKKPVVPDWLANSRHLHQADSDPMRTDIESRYHWIEQVTARSRGDGQAQNAGSSPSLSERVDAILIHKIWGLLIFAVVMSLLFVTIFWLAQPIMQWIQDGVQWTGGRVAAHLPRGPMRDLATDGVIAGVGAVVAFVPQIALLFIFLAILEDSGYLARAAFLMDRLLRRVGLHGKSFIPLLSSFACAIPGIMATRTIENRKDRLATILIAPFMGCSARLPVYTLLIGTFFAARGAGVQSGIMLAVYAAGVLAAAGTAWCFRRTLLKGSTDAFIMELPTYKLPQVSEIARQVWVNTSEFLTKAGTVIFCMSVLLWALTYYGASQKYLGHLEASGAPANVVAAERMNHSLAGQFGHFIEPGLRPLGFDWKMGVGLVSAFAAREVFVSTMGIVYSTGDVEDGHGADLSKAMLADRYPDGRRVWNGPVAVSLLVWFVLAMQCMSTLAVVRRETGGWGWPIFMLIYMNALAYVVCLFIFQVSRWVG
ncbi:MAG: ferrous iron transport protein B [Tepidisphaeraceae bacterium]|jgi:ferrous iron transport protein B